MSSPIKPIVRMGQPILFQRAREVDFTKQKDLKEIIESMIATMQHLQGVGIAAPQIGYDLRIILFGFEHSNRYPNEKPIPITTLINPNIEFIGQQQVSGWEGCLSIPGLRGLVPRYQEVSYQGFDIKGSRISGTATGFLARILQHEIDHIDGRLYPSRINDFSQFGFEDCLQLTKS